MRKKQISLNPSAHIFTPSHLGKNPYTLPDTHIQILAVLPQIVSAPDVDIVALQSAIADKFHPNMAIQRPTGCFSKRIVHVHGPSAAGKSRLAFKLCTDLGGPSKAIILTRDRYIQNALDNHNRTNKTRLEIPHLYTHEGKPHTWAFQQVFNPADKAMHRDMSKAHREHKVVIWDTMKALDKHLDLTDTLVIRMVTCCLDLPENRDFATLAHRHHMSPEKQQELAAIVFPEKLYATQLENNGPSPVLFNAFYGWRSGENPLEVKVFYELVLSLCCQRGLGAVAPK